MRVAVTGATGNVGSVLVRRLLAEGHDVVGVCRRPPPPGVAPYDAVTWHALDLTAADAEPRLQEAFAGADAVVHLAWGFQPSHRLDHLEALGVGGTGAVARAVILARVPHLVHMSSVGAYSPRTGSAPVTEDFATDGVPGSPYSRHKAAAERLLDELEAGPVAGDEAPLVTRLRPGIIGQREAGSALLRYGVPGFVPAGLLGHVPLLPLDRSLAVPVVHVDDVVDAVARVLERHVGGAFNLATSDPVTAEAIAGALGARLVPTPAPVLRATVDGLWRARLLQLDPGWIDLAYAVPLMDTSRARTALGWSPSRTGAHVLAETVDGLLGAASGTTPVLRPRSLGDTLRRLVQDGPVHHRLEP